MRKRSVSIPPVRPDLRALRLRCVPFACFALVVAASCRPAPDDDHHQHDHETDAEVLVEDGEIAVPLAGLRGLRIVEAPEPRAEGAWFPGEAVADPSAQVVLATPLGGIVRRAPELTGRPVRAGATLLALDSPEKAELIARWLSASADVDAAKANLTREVELGEAQATSLREIEDARRIAATAEAQMEAARLAIEARGLSVDDRSAVYVLRAPGNGSVVRWEVSLGQSVEAGARLGSFQTAAARLVTVELPLPGPDWKLGDAAEARASDGQQWRARVVGLPAALDEATLRLEYVLEITEGPLPLPGRPVEVRVPFASGVILPQAAVQQIEGIWGVFKVEDDGAHFVRVRRGVELGGDVMVLDGIDPGDRLVADGAYLLKSLWLKGKAGGDAHDH